MDEALLQIGYVGRAHGVAGEFKVFPETDDPRRFLDLKEVFVGPNATNVRAHEIENARFQSLKGRTIVLLKLRSIGSPEMAETLTRQAVFARVADLPPLEEGELFIHDMIGMEVVEEKGSVSVGIVRDVLEGAQLLLVVARDGAPDVLIPDVPQIVISIDPATRRIVVDPPEGLY